MRYIEGERPTDIYIKPPPKKERQPAVEINTGDVRSDLDLLERQLIILSNTVERLNDSGISIDLRVKIKSESFIKRVLKVKR